MSHLDIQDVVAHVKPEYVLPIERQSGDGQTAAADQPPGEPTLEPPAKKQKLSGMNKNRPKLVKVPRNEKLCRFVWCVKLGDDPRSLCPNPNCDFSHDPVAFLAAKPPDLGNKCHNFRTFGHCNYGIMCRFGSEHIESGCNKVNEDLWAKHKDSPAVVNSLTKELQVALRKRTYVFNKAIKYLHEAQAELRKGRVEAKGTPSSDKSNSEKQAVNGSLLNASVGENENKRESLQKTGGCKTDDKDGDGNVQPEGSKDSKESLEGMEGCKIDDKDIDSNVQTEGSKDSEEGKKESLGKMEGCNTDDKDVAKLSNVQEDRDSSDNFSSNANTEVMTKKEESVGGENAHPDQRHRKADEKPMGPVSDEDIIKVLSREKKKITWNDKLYLAPLTTLGNLPFRRVCKSYGVDITCSEMAMAKCLLQGSQSEWALVKRHQSETLFGIQVCGNNPAVMIMCSQLLEEKVDFDFLDINMGCPLDFVYKQGGGSGLMRRVGCLEQMVRGMNMALSRPLTLKMRTAIYHNTRVAHNIINKAKLWDVSMVTVHGRSREQRYLKLADWDYIDQCARTADPMPVFGNGDILSFEDYNSFRERSKVAGVMIGRGALVKPWVFREIKEQRHWDISSSERFDMLKLYVNYGLEHWGSDTEGIEKTRRFLLEWLSFLHRYIPVGILESTQRLNQRPPAYKGRDYLETLMASRASSDWIKISEMLLGPTPPDFKFLPKHRANSY